MKSSYYNLFFPHDGKFILFNALRGPIFVVDSEIKRILEKNEISFLDEELIHTFADNDIIVEDELNEQDVYRLLFERSKYSTVSTTVEVVTTYACNLACTYCYEGKGELESKKMDERTVECALEFIKGLVSGNNSTELKVTLFGGEPLLNMPANVLLAEELCRWCEENSRDFFINAVTNGTLLAEETVEDLAQYNCGFLVVLDGPRKIHDQRRMYKNGEGTFDDICEGLHRVTDHGLRINIRINLDQTNRDHIVSFFEFLKQEGLTDISLNITPVFKTSPACSSYSYCMTDMEGALAATDLYNVARSMNITVGRKDRPSCQGACRAQKYSNFIIDPFLRLFKCNIQLPFSKNAVGRINPENSEPEFNQLYFDLMLRDPFSVQECRICRLLPLCRGGCLAKEFENMGSAREKMCRKQPVYETLQEDLRAFVKK
ncbi:MAG: radical SAM protein [Theionarchaea archaeon]|nr:radical SAM protein [Theionarchaea archaeon]